MKGDTMEVRDASPRYAPQVEMPVVPEGYKLTEVGVIPEDWEAVPARELGIFKGGNGFPLRVQGDTAGDYPFFKVSDMNNDGNAIFMSSAQNYISDVTRKRLGAYIFPAGSIVFAKVGAAIFIERKKILAQASCVDNNMAGYVLDHDRADVRYMHSLLLSRRLGALVSTTALPALNGKQLGDMVLPLPPITEQRVIATALGDVDALLEALDRLIAKKRDIKQATMQQLLTAQTRLPGFEGEWETVRFCEIASLSNVRIDPSRSVKSEFCVELEQIEQRTGRLIGCTSTSSQSSLKSVFGSGDVLFGKLRAYLRKYWLADREGVCSTEIWVLKPNPQKVVSGYLYQLVRTDWFIEAASTAYGTHMPRSDWKVVRELELSVPELAEQEAISRALGDMDAELENLQQRRTKTAAFKQAMMQELLTGRTRLVKPQAVTEAGI